MSLKNSKKRFEDLKDLNEFHEWCDSLSFKEKIAEARRLGII